MFGGAAESGAARKAKSRSRRIGEIVLIEVTSFAKLF
jgi:hypothetical protein